MGSPKAGGNTEALVSAFRKGAESAGHSVHIFNVCRMNIHPCTDCRYCYEHRGACAIKDDMAQIYPHLYTDDVIVFATPVYWWGVTAQLKLVIDKFYARATRLGKGKRIATVVIGGAELDDPEYEIIQKQFACIADYLEWEIVFAKSIFATGPKDLAGDEEALAELEAFGAGL